MRRDIKAYYSCRANEYDSIYAKPERQSDLANLRRLVSSAFRARNVLEIACGTGYWTQYIARTASQILAIDYSEAVLDIARLRSFGDCPVEFRRSDAYDLEKVPQAFDSGFLGFWISHIPIQDLSKFLLVFHSKLLPGAKVVMIDNRFVPGSSTPISRRDSRGNTYQIRELGDGVEFEVLKNFLNADTLREYLTPVSLDLSITQFDYFWMVQYKGAIA